MDGPIKDIKTFRETGERWSAFEDSSGAGLLDGAVRRDGEFHIETKIERQSALRKRRSGPHSALPSGGFPVPLRRFRAERHRKGGTFARERALPAFRLMSGEKITELSVGRIHSWRRGTSSVEQSSAFYRKQNLWGVPREVCKAIHPLFSYYTLV